MSLKDTQNVPFFPHRVGSPCPSVFSVPALILKTRQNLRWEVLKQLDTITSLGIWVLPWSWDTGLQIRPLPLQWLQVYFVHLYSCWPVFWTSLPPSYVHLWPDYLPSNSSNSSCLGSWALPISRFPVLSLSHTWGGLSWRGPLHPLMLGLGLWLPWPWGLSFTYFQLWQQEELLCWALVKDLASPHSILLNCTMPTTSCDMVQLDIKYYLMFYVPTT